MMKSGQYYIGDLCYVLRDSWDNVCDLIGTSETGVYKLKNGTEFAIFNTTYGDGTYVDQNGNEYPVDSGTIGCVKVSKVEDKSGLSNGYVRKFSKPFDVMDVGGLLYFGDIEIQTNDDDEDDDSFNEED